MNASISVNSSRQVPGPKHQKYDRARCRALSGRRCKQMTLLLHPIERTYQKNICWNCEHLTVETMRRTGCRLKFLFSTRYKGLMK